jgi:hypothetical protein
VISLIRPDMLLLLLLLLLQVLAIMVCVLSTCPLTRH